MLFSKTAITRVRVQRILVFALCGVVVASMSWAQAKPGAADPKPAPQAASSQPAPCQETLTQIYNRVSPSVVLINAASVNPYDPDHRIQRVSGSGVIFQKSGLIITNAHVVFGRQILTVTLDDGTSLPAQMVGADPVFDIAVIRIPTPTRGELPVAGFGDSDAMDVGQEVVAIGNPLGLNQTLTRGIVSAVNRMLPGSSFSLTEPMIQTDAAINPGNSGGPLLNRCGEVIGINTAVVPDAENIGFAVPSNLVKFIVPALVKDGRLIRSWIGLQGQFVSPVLKELLRVPLPDGFIIEAVEPGSPAERAGVQGGEFELTIGGVPVLLGGDIITEVNGTKITDPDTLERIMRALKVGEKVHLVATREVKTVTFDITVEERPILSTDLPERRVGALMGSTGARAVTKGKGVIVF